MDTPDRGMSDRAIEDALAAVRDRIAQAERDRADLDRRIAADQEEEKLLARLLALRRGEPAQALGAGPAPATRPRPAESEADGGNAAVRAVFEEISAAGRPVHISELMRLLGERKVSIPGAGTQANLITHLRRDRRLVRPSRGMYGLAEWGLEAMPAGRRKRRKRIKARAGDGRKDA
jgi:hypothetical protein